MSSATVGEIAKPRSGKSAALKVAFRHLNLSLTHCAKAVFRKPCIELMDLLQLDEREAKYRLSAKRKFTAPEIAALLQSEHGIHFLVVLMDRARPRWWKAVLKMGVLGTVEERRRADAELLTKVFHADADSSAAFTAAFRAQDPVFYGALLAGHDEMSAPRASDRAMAKGRRK